MQTVTADKPHNATRTLNLDDDEFLEVGTSIYVYINWFTMSLISLGKPKQPCFHRENCPCKETVHILSM